MYFMFVIVGAGGLMVTANLKPIAVDWKVDNIPVTLMWVTMTAVTFAATIDRVLNGLTRPFFGWISDMIGRENTMFIAFGMEGVGIWALTCGSRSVWFVLLSGFVFFVGARSTRCSRRPAATPSARSSPPATPACSTPPRAPRRCWFVANYMQQSSGTWDNVFIIAAGANIRVAAAILVLAVAKVGGSQGDRILIEVRDKRSARPSGRALFVRRASQARPTATADSGTKRQRSACL
jgi:OFA family oxalate/formate antiporter-like MFS transporter